MARSVLIIDDEPAIRDSLKGVLEDEGYSVITASCGSEGVDFFRKENPDVVLLDIWMPGMDGIETLQQIRGIASDSTVIMISGHGTIETAVRCTKLGAFDFIEKPLSLEKVILTVSNAIESSRLNEENRLLRSELTGKCDLAGISDAVLQLKEQLKKAAQYDAHTIITGEKGAGKEVVSQAMHRCGRRASRPYMRVRCGSIPDQLSEAEIFGVERNSASGINGKRGKIEIAEGGTLFLSDINLLPLNVQKLLTDYIDDHVYRRSGGVRTFDADVRIVASISESVEQCIQNGQLLPALSERLSSVVINVPPLRDRKADIPYLIESIQDQFGSGRHARKLDFTPEVLDLFERYDWRGNVRELKNVVERIYIMADTERVTMDDLPEYIARLNHHSNQDDLKQTESLKDARILFEKEYLTKKLEENDWNLSITAESLKVDRSILMKKIKLFGIEMNNH